MRQREQRVGTDKAITCGSTGLIEPFSMLLLSMQAQYGGNRQYRCEHNGHAHKSPQNDCSQPIGCSFSQQVTTALLGAVTEVFRDIILSATFEGLSG